MKIISAIKKLPNSLQIGHISKSRLLRQDKHTEGITPTNTEKALGAFYFSYERHNVFLLHM